MVYSTNLYFKILFYYNTHNNHIYKIYTQSKQRKVTKGQSDDITHLTIFILKYYFEHNKNKII